MVSIQAEREPLNSLLTRFEVALFLCFQANGQC
jgi:hypothetical protein